MGTRTRLRSLLMNMAGLGPNTGQFDDRKY